MIVAFCYLSWNADRIEQVRRFSGAGRRPGRHPLRDVDPAQGVARRGRVCGVGGFQRWRHGPLTVEIAKPQHPICHGLPPAIRWEDEPYRPPTPPIDPEHVQVLAGSREQTEPGQEGVALQPQFWTYERGRGRVFGCVPGHYSWTFDDPYFRLLLLRGMAWAARESPFRFDAAVLLPRRFRHDRTDVSD